MKKVVLLLLAILLPNICFAENDEAALTKNNSGVISNKRGLITSVRKEGAIGYICPKWSISKSDCFSGKLVYFDIDFNEDIIDFQRFTVPKDSVFYAEGSYTYKVKRHKQRTVRRIKLRKKDTIKKEDKLTLFRL